MPLTPGMDISSSQETEGSPRNHWRQISKALLAIADNRGAESWRYLSSVRYSPLLAADAISHTEALLVQGLGGYDHMAVEKPSDFLRVRPGAPGPVMLRQLPAKRDLPKGFPYEMVLPPLTGNCNDFSFITRLACDYGFAGPVPNQRLRLIVHVRDETDLTVMTETVRLAAGTFNRLPSVSLCVFAPAHLPKPDLPVRTDWLTGTAWQMEREGQLTILADGADTLLFVPLRTLADPLLAERTLRYLALYPDLCLVLNHMDPGTSAIGQSMTVLAERNAQASMRENHAAFQKLDSLGFAISAAQFRRVGGFDPRFATETFACRELAFRVYNNGGYFMPLAARTGFGPSSSPEAPDDPDDPDDRGLYTALCPHPLMRKRDGRFEVPKVSIYIPAYRAARYLRDAIDSVLAQDYHDFEICVADDGSPDNTLRVLEDYASDPRVRWQTGCNGGIGHASNRAIRMSRGLYIGQLDSDDRLLPGAVRRLAEFLDENPAVGCVYGSCERVDSEGRYLHKEYSFPKFSREKMMLASIAHHFRMFRRQVWERSEGFREDIVNAVDYDIFLKLSEVSKLHHIDEILYQRRWHGENTSSVNEAYQTQNTYRVQREALTRLGISRYWDVHVPDPKNPRIVTYIRTGTTNRAIFWPDYSGSNPYQRRLYAKAARLNEILGGDINVALQVVSEMQPGDEGQVTFHLHWLNKLFQQAQNAGEAARAAQDFLVKLRKFQFCGGRVVWTIHNTVSHDLPFPQVERQLAREIAALADAIHIHSLASLPEIEAEFPIPREKVHIHRHGAYLGSYPDFVDRDTARAELGVATEDEVMLFFGQMRPYKGLEMLLETFRALLPERPQLRLVMAGAGQIDTMLAEARLSETERARITIHNRFIDDMELQLFFKAADFAVFPYRNILTSGSLMLALSYGVPSIIPDYGMTREILGDESCGLLYPATADASVLSATVRRMFAQRDAGEALAMAGAARRRAAEETWDDISLTLFGQKGL